MPDIIHLLPDSVANQIAAGEVIQRPASLIKELVENSVDSGSTEIKIIIKEAGKTLVQVIDNGCGMSDTDARLAFERHATSKINKAEDLFLIRTMGFRGEALASIAAVAQVELKTRKQEDELGTHIIIAGSVVESQTPASCPAGTNIIVKNLFFNIPARRKFLKTNSTELRHIIVEFQRIALTLPEIAFSLYHNDSEIYNLPEVSSLPQRISGIYGRGILPNLIPVKTETTIVNIKGYIGKPEFARKTYGEQYLFVNHRFMRHPYFHKAIMEAYKEILPPETVPSYFLYFEINPESIDINIHPTKTEIKFEDERAIWQILHASIREALGKFNIVPSLDFNTEGVIDIPVLRKGQEADPPKVHYDPTYNPFERNQSSNAFTNPNQPSPLEKSNLENWDRMYSGLEKENSLPKEAPIPGTSDQGTLPIQETGIHIFQFKNKYILTPVKSGLMIIDQKRAHEKILFENYLNLIKTEKAPVQQSLFPESIELNPDDYVLLKEILDDLNHLGFDINDLGNRSVIINGYPPETDGGRMPEIIDSILEKYKTTASDLIQDRTEKIAVSLAKTAAIPYGKQLSTEEMRNFIDQLFACSTPNYSPTGKIIVSIIDLDEFEKRFQ
jgi:DNA mismatch repair protein MutL